MQVTPTVVLSALATVLAAGVGAFAWRRRDAVGAAPLAAFMLGTAIWAGGSAAQAAATTLEWKLFWIRVQFLGVPLLPTGALRFACEYADRERWCTSRRLVWLALPLVAVAVLAWTNGAHHLVWSSVELVGTDPVRIDATREPAFWFTWLYSQVLNVVATAVLLFAVFDAGSVVRRQGLAIVGGALVPWAAQLANLAELLRIDPIAFSAVTGLAFAYAISRHGLLEVGPVARSVVVRDLGDAVLVVDDDGRLVDANPSAMDELGLADAALGEPVEAALADHPRLADLVRDAAGLRATDADWRPAASGGGRAGADADRPAAATAASGLLELDCDGESRYFDVRASALGDDGGTAVVLRDVTERREARAALRRQNERLARVGDAMAHDLRNPLTVAHGYLEEARAGDPEALDEVEDALERIDEIVEETLAMARGGDPGAREPVRLGAVARDAWQAVQTGDASLVVDPDGTVAADRAQLQQLLENLFRNAVEHGSTSPGSQAREDPIEHGSTSGDDDRATDGLTVRVEATEDGFAVADDGPGIPPEEREAVLQRGYTTTESGTGIGLATVETIAALHGWSVRVEESAAGGARFAFRATDGEAGDGADGTTEGEQR